MNILFIDSTIHLELIGGGHIFLSDLLAGLVDRGHQVGLIVSDEPNKRVKEQIKQSGCVLYKDIYKRNLLVEDKTPLLASWINERSPDVFVISSSADVGWTVLPHLKPSIATFMIGHSNADAFYGPLTHYAEFITGAIGVSEEISRNYQVKCGIPESMIFTVPYGIKAANSISACDSSTDDPIELIYSGRLEDTYKRASDLILIAKELTKQAANYKLTIIGDGSLMQKFETELSNEVSTGKVTMTGWISKDELLLRLRKADVVLLVSDSEGFSISLVEAMANGCCPIVTNIESGNKQLVADGENGYLVEVGAIGKFIERISELAKDRKNLFQMREKAWLVGREFSLDRMVENYISTFQAGVEYSKKSPRQIREDFPLMETCRSPYPLWMRRIKAIAGF